MDVFERVRDVNAGTGLTEDRIIGARIRLLQGIDDSRSAERKRLLKRPMFLIAGAVAGAAAVTAGVVVVSQLTAPSPHVEAIPAPTAGPREPGQTVPKPEPTSGTTITEPYPGTTPQAGQYLHVGITSERLLYRDGRVFVWPAHGDFPPISGLLVREYSQTYVPADRSGDWYFEWGPSSERVQFFPEDQGPAGELAWDNQVPVNPEVIGSWNTGGQPGDGDVQTGSTAWYAPYPRDPQALLDYLRAQAATYAESPEAVDDALIENLIFTIQSNIAPADVRAAFIGALELSGLAQKETTADGKTRYQVHRALFDARTETLTIDPATGWATEYTLRYDRTDGAAGDMVPANIPDIRATYTVSIVNSVP
ncbi:hypothetical protein [Microbacterium sp. LBN7]|uniref:hypothetical protein n=1 Tax=Microbacterium sp. LBN7 TaxID=3129773 RepID=UPI0032500144